MGFTMVITPINRLRVAPNSSLRYGIFDNPYLPSTCEQKHANLFYCDGFSLIQSVDGRCIMYHVIIRNSQIHLEMNQTTHISWICLFQGHLVSYWELEKGFVPQETWGGPKKSTQNSGYVMKCSHIKTSANNIDARKFISVGVTWRKPQGTYTKLCGIQFKQIFVK